MQANGGRLSHSGEAQPSTNSPVTVYELSRRQHVPSSYPRRVSLSQPTERMSQTASNS